MRRSVTAGRLDSSGDGPLAAPRAWIEVRVALAAEAAEAVSEILGELRPGGLIEERPAAGRVRFCLYLPPSRVLRQTLAAARTRIKALPAYGLDPGRVSLTYRRVRGRRWATAWRAHVRPVRVGRVVVRPTWIRVPPRPGDIVVAIDPGMAFGTGAHPSTRLALRALDTALRPRPGSTVIDVGTGSGILAVAAAGLGAGRVEAVDCDPVAVAAARANVRLNGCARHVRVAEGSGLGPILSRARVIVANIVADTVVDVLPDAAARLEPGGVFVGSGIVAGRVRGVLRAGRAAGLRPDAVLRDGDWRAVVFSARPRSGWPASPARRSRRPRHR